jgi:membrane-associated phospholipid phosphatase
LVSSFADHDIVATGFAGAVEGVHRPSDAIAGTLVGLISAWAVVNTLHPGDG